MLERAIIIAAEAHAGQLDDKSGQPYILHPLRVMLNVNNEEARICGVLHDVIEDTSLTQQDLIDEGIPPHLVEVVEMLSKRSDDEDYDAFIERICESELACRVKLADLKDNMDLSRIPTPTAQDFLRMEKYRRAHLRITEALKEFELQQQVAPTLDNAISQAPPR